MNNSKGISPKEFLHIKGLSFKTADFIQHERKIYTYVYLDYLSAWPSSHSFKLAASCHRNGGKEQWHLGGEACKWCETGIAEKRWGSLDSRDQLRLFNIFKATHPGNGMHEGSTEDWTREVPKTSSWLMI